ncbi:hypothetical protein JCM8097_005151 [Rhodosporidiobolus ruineniae]
MNSAPPTPLRPSCRTRRRSSSFSSFTSAHSPDQHQAPWPRRGSRPEGKRAKRAPVSAVAFPAHAHFANQLRSRSLSARSPPTLQSDSPLKHSQPLFAPVQDDDLGTSFWTQSSPFTASLASSSSTTPVPPHSSAAAGAPSTAASLFSASASDFSLPSSAQRWQQRGRHPSTESTWSSSLSSSPRALVSFEDSSFSSSTSAYHSDSSPSDSLHSVSPTPFTFSCFAAHGPPAPPPVLRRVSSCHSPMACDGGDLTPVEAPAERDQEAEDEAARLHHVAFEQLRSATRADQEGFVERMRRWEAERAPTGDLVLPDEEAEAADDEGAEQVDSEGEEEEDDEDEVEVTLDLGAQCDARSPPAVTGFELDELSRRLRAGACELEDFSLVREVQARARSRARAAVSAQA